MASFAAEYATGRTSLDEAKTRFAVHDFTGALEAGKKSRNVLLSILDALALQEVHLDGKDPEPTAIVLQKNVPLNSIGAVPYAIVIDAKGQFAYVTD